MLTLPPRQPGQVLALAPYVGQLYTYVDMLAVLDPTLGLALALKPAASQVMLC